MRSGKKVDEREAVVLIEIFIAFSIRLKIFLVGLGDFIPTRVVFMRLLTFGTPSFALVR